MGLICFAGVFLCRSNHRLNSAFSSFYAIFRL